MTDQVANMSVDNGATTAKLMQLKVEITNNFNKQLGGKSVTFYEVSVNLGRRVWKLEKRYNEFSELDKILRSKHPNLPNMPGKTFFAMTEKASIETRKTGLNSYLKVSEDWW